MAEQRRPRKKGGGDISPHPLVEALVPDPSQPPIKSTRLFGYPGPSTDQGATRLYLDQELTSYVDVPKDAILHSQTLENDGGTIVWVDPTATLRYSTTQAHEVQADFLSGGIQEQHLAGAAPGLAGGTIHPTLWTQLMCPSNFRVCPSAVDACPSALGCTHVGCLSHAGISACIQCPPLSRAGASVCILCPSGLGCTVGIACIPSRIAPCTHTAATRCEPSLGIPCHSVPACPSGFVCGGPIGGPIDPIG